MTPTLLKKIHDLYDGKVGVTFDGKNYTLAHVDNPAHSYSFDLQALKVFINDIYKGSK